VDNEKALLRVLQHVPVAVVIANPLTARILWVNGRLTQMYGVENPAQVVGSSLLDFIQVDQAAKALADLAKVVAGASPPPVTYQLKRADGGFAAGQVSSVPMLFQGQPAMLSFVTDVSECERMLRSLRDSEDRYRLLLDELPSGVVVLIDDRVVWTNGSMARALGFDSADALIGQPLYDYIDEPYRKPVRQTRRSVMLSGDLHPTAPVVLLRPDGSKVTATTSTSRIRWEGELATQTVMYGFGDVPAEPTATEDTTG